MKIDKPVRLITLFSGYDSQKKAFDYLDLQCEHWKTCEWAIKSIQALKDLHFKDDNTDYSKDLTREQVVEYLANKGISANYNAPLTLKQVDGLAENKLRQIYNNIQATHNLVNIQQAHGKDFEIVDIDKYCYVMTYSFPCQDLSLAGKGAGMSRDSGTRSGMLWEVERILKELKEGDGNLPNILVMENVPQVHGEGNYKDFLDWCAFLKSIGYTNSWSDLNAKNYGIPQNRERTFMVSILNNDGNIFQFPQPIKLKFRLKDLLEKEVDEKYYLSEKVLKKLTFTNPDSVKDVTGVDLCDTKSEFRDIANTIKSRYDCGYEHFSPGPTGVAEPNLKVLAKTEDGNNFNSVYDSEGVSPTLLARDYKDPIRVGESTDKCVQVAQLEGNFESTGRIYSQEGLSPTINTCGGGNREPKIVAENEYVGTYDYNKSDNFMQGKDRLQVGTEVANSILTTHADGVVVNEPRIAASRGRNPENPNSRVSGEHTEQRLELGPDGLSNTLTTVQKDNYVVEPQGIQHDITTQGDSNIVENNMKRQLCNELIRTNAVSEGDVIRHSYTNKRMHDGAIANSENPDCCSTLDTRADTLGVVVANEDEPKVIGGIGEKKSNGGTQYYQQDRVYDDKIGISVTTSFNPYYKANLRIRKLTPKECFRLMGIEDEDFEKVAKNQSNASLYHLAGDSIVTVCLMAIFGKLFGIDYREKINKLLKTLNPNFDFDKFEPDVVAERHSLLDDLFD